MKNKNRRRSWFLPFILTLGMVPVPSSSQTAKDSWKNDARYKTGTLKDGTPSALSDPGLRVGPQGPFLLIVYIDRPNLPIDLRPEEARDKVKFTLISGKGSFAPFDHPDSPKSDSLNSLVDMSGITAVVFYPSPAADGIQKIEVKAECAALPSGQGELRFRFSTTALPLGDYAALGKKHSQELERWRFLSFKRTSSYLQQSFLDLNGEETVKTLTSKMKESWKKGEVTQTDLSNPQKQPKKNQLDPQDPKWHDDLSGKSPYGYDGQNLLYLETSKPNSFGDVTFMFYFVDKETGLFNRMIFVNLPLSDTSDYGYLVHGGIAYPLWEQLDAVKNNGKKESHSRMDYKYSFN